ncbi:MAG: DUF2167 domain-containing protein [Dongiaceae bacterium]
MRASVFGAAGLLLVTGLAFGQEAADPESMEAEADQRVPFDEAAVEEPHPLSQLDWVVGPTDVEIGRQARLAVPEGFMFLNPQETAKFQELIENPTSGRESLIAPDDLRWFGLFAFDDVGYVKDDEDIDADELLDSVKEGTEYANEERRKKGWAELHITGWRFEPRYDSSTQRLEWAIDAVSENQPVVNFNTRLLGRKGVTAATLVAEPATLDAAVAEFKDILTGFEYVAGERYADVQEGDHMAEYGLAALIAGGGAAVAAKSGLLKSLWKVLAVAGVAVAAWFGKFFKGKKQQDA